MSITKIQVENPDPILSRTALDGQTVARVAHLNNIVDQVNDSFNYSVLGFNIVANGGGSTIPGLVGVGQKNAPGPGIGGCRPGTQPYTYSNGTHGCISSTLRLAYGNYLPVVTKSEVGIYVFTFPVAPPLGYDVLLSPPAALIGSRIQLAKTSATVFTITTQNASGVAADSLLTGMYLEIKIYS